MQSTSCDVPAWMTHKLESRLLGFCESLFYQYTFENVDIETSLIFPNAPCTWYVLLHLVCTMLIISRGYKCKNKQKRGFFSELVVENLPANAGDRVSIPGLGRSHMPQKTGPVCHSC